MTELELRFATNRLTADIHEQCSSISLSQDFVIVMSTDMCSALVQFNLDQRIVDIHASEYQTFTFGGLDVYVSNCDMGNTPAVVARRVDSLDRNHTTPGYVLLYNGDLYHTTGNSLKFTGVKSSSGASIRFENSLEMQASAELIAFLDSFDVHRCV